VPLVEDERPKGGQVSLYHDNTLWTKIRKYKARKEREGNSNLEKWQSWIESKSVNSALISMTAWLLHRTLELKIIYFGKVQISFNYSEVF
jgi:hypothetical protein